MKLLSEMRIAKAVSIVFSLLGVLSIFISFPDQDIKLKIIIIGGCVLVSLASWIFDAYLEIHKLKQVNENLKKSTLEIEKNRKYLSDKAAAQQRKIDAFRREWTIIQTCISSHAIRDNRIEFEHLQEVYANSTTVIVNSGGFTDDDESKNI